MHKNHLRTRLLAAAGSMLAAGALALSGIVAAAAAPSSSGASGIEHFQVMSTSHGDQNHGDRPGRVHRRGR